MVLSLQVDQQGRPVLYLSQISLQGGPVRPFCGRFKPLFYLGRQSETSAAEEWTTAKPLIVLPTKDRCCPGHYCKNSDLRSRLSPHRLQSDWPRVTMSTVARPGVGIACELP